MVAGDRLSFWEILIQSHNIIIYKGRFCGVADEEFIYEKLTRNDIAYIGILLFVNLLFVADRVLYLNAIPVTPEGLESLNGLRLFEIPAIGQALTAFIWCMVYGIKMTFV